MKVYLPYDERKSVFHMLASMQTIKCLCTSNVATAFLNLERHIVTKVKDTYILYIQS